MNILKASCKSAFKSLLCGFVGIAFCCWSDEPERGPNLILMIFFLTALNFFLVFAFVVGFLLPLSRIEKKKIEKNTSVELLKRYLPIIIFPIALIYLFIIKSALTKDTAALLFLIGIGIINQFSIGLWTFLKELKST